MEGSESRHCHTSDGAIEGEQRVALDSPVVDFSTAGAERLGRAYWREVCRVTGSLARSASGKARSSCGCSVSRCYFRRLIAEAHA